MIYAEEISFLSDFYLHSPTNCFFMKLSFSTLFALAFLLIGVNAANAASNELSSVTPSATSDTLITSQVIPSEFHITADHQGVLDSLEALGVLEGRTIAAGVTNIFSLWDSLQVIVEAPTMTITASELNDGDLSNATTLSLTFVSTKKTSTFLPGDITVINGSISALNGTGAGGAEYTATFTTDVDGACTIDVAAGVYESLTGSLNEAAEQFGWTFDGTPPTLTITSTEVIDGDASNDGTLSLTFTFSESISDFVVGDVTTSNGTLSAFAGSGATYTATFTPTGFGPCTIYVNGSTFTDAVGNNNTAAQQFTWTYDVTPPTMTITAAEVSDGATSNDAALTLTFTSSESTTDFGVGDITVTNGTLATFAGSGTTYTATFTPTGFGACTIYVNGSTFTDAAGNNNTAAQQFTWTYGVLGCTDSTASNYDASATNDDNSCIAAVNGCMNAAACNYNASANTEDEECSCSYSPTCFDCAADVDNDGICDGLDPSPGAINAPATKNYFSTNTQNSNMCNLQCWLDASSVHGFDANGDVVELSNNTSVSTWVDLSGKNNHLYSFGNGLPTYTNNAAFNTLSSYSGNAIMKFNGVRMQNTEAALNITDKVTCYYVIEQTSQENPWNATVLQIGLGDDIAPTTVLHHYHFGTYPGTWDNLLDEKIGLFGNAVVMVNGQNWNGYYVNTANSKQVNQAAIYKFEFNDGTISLHRNSFLIASKIGASLDDYHILSSRLQLGDDALKDDGTAEENNIKIDINVAELMIFNTDLTSGEDQNIMNYLNGKWLPD